MFSEIGIEIWIIGQVINSWIFEEFKIGIEINLDDILVVSWNVFLYLEINHHIMMRLLLRLILKILKRGLPLLIF